MENARKLTWRIWESKGMGRALLIGGLIAYVPIINLLLLGYYGKWIQRLVTGKGLDLPDWSDWREILRETARVLVPVVVWAFVPFFVILLLVWALAGVLDFLHLGFFAATIAWLPLSFVLVITPVAATFSLIRLYETGALKAALDIPSILREVLKRLPDCLFPLFQYYGILLLGWPLLGFAAFLASLPLHAQLILISRNPDRGL